MAKSGHYPSMQVFETCGQLPTYGEWNIHKKKRVWEPTPGMHACVLLMILLFASGALAQEVFRSNDAGSYNDQFLTNCHTANPPNIFAQLGMNPMACRGQVAPADSRRQCSLTGMTLLRQFGNTCYYCSPYKPPISGIIIPYDQVGYAAHQGFACGVNQIDPNCSAICTKSSGSKQYQPPPAGGESGSPGPTAAGINGPCEDYTGLDMNTPEGRAAAYQRCSDSLCRHNPDLQRCKGSTAQAPPAPVSAPPLVSCTVSVAFERVGMLTAVPATNGSHAVILIGGDGVPLTGYEGYPSGNPKDWGVLVAQERNLSVNPLKHLYGVDGAPVFAGLLLESCPAVRLRMEALVRVINSAGLPYTPVPEFDPNKVNSNNFTYWALGRLGIQPPAPPGDTHAYGYNAAIR